MYKGARACDDNDVCGRTYYMHVFYTARALTKLNQQASVLLMAYILV